MKILFPKQTSLAIAASLCLFSIGNAQEDQERPQNRDRDTRLSVQEGELHGKIMPLKAFLSADDPTSTASREGDETDQPLVLVVDDRRGARTDTDTATDDTATDRDQRDRRFQARTGERAYVLVFQNDTVKEKAERICKENKGKKEEAKAAGEEDAASVKNQVAVTGERSFRGGLMAIMVSDISDAGQGAEGTTTETRTQTETDTGND